MNQPSNRTAQHPGHAKSHGPISSPNTNILSFSSPNATVAARQPSRFRGDNYPLQPNWGLGFSPGSGRSGFDLFDSLILLKV
ncbi:hypothetical protein AKJ16_DCAP22846 [Drosera capensis]